MSKSLEVTVAIVGAGPVGATLAAALAAGGVRCAVIDAAPLPPMELPAFDGRCYAVAAGSRPVLQAAGVCGVLGKPFTSSQLLAAVREAEMAAGPA